MKIMRALMFLTAAVFIWQVSGGAAAARTVLQHDLTVRLEPSANRIEGQDVVAVKGGRMSFIDFHLAEHLTVDRVFLDGQNTRFEFENGRLRVSLASGKSDYHLQIAYSGIFNDTVPNDPVNTDNPGFGVSGVIRPEGTLLLAGAGWYPRVEAGDSAYVIKVIAPEGMVAVTAGNPIGLSTQKGLTVSRWQVGHPLRGIPLVAGRYIVKTRRFGKITAATYFSSGLQHLSDGYLDAAGRYLMLYEKLFGPYAFGQFAVVENFFPTGYGFPSFTLMGRRVLQLPFIKHTSLGHEIAHSWWGNGVLVNYDQGNWCEGLTAYVADYLYKERSGEGRDYRLQWLRNYAALIRDGKDFAPSEFMSRVDPVTKVVGYDKVAMVFHMLRKKVGEEAFWQTLRDVYARYRFKAAAWSDLQAAFERRSGMPLEGFFKQWVFRPGAPLLTLSQVGKTATADGYVVRGAVVQAKPYYDLQLDMTLTTDQDTRRKTVSVSGPRTPFSMTAPHRPRELAADPDVDIMRRLSPQEVPPTVNSLKDAGTTRVIVSKNLDGQWMAIARRLCIAMGLDQRHVGMEGDYSPAEMKNSDLLFVGRPSNSAWIPNAGGRFAVRADGFELNGRRYPGGQDSFFGVFAHPANRSRTMGLFIAQDFADANSISAKIPHYGKYSYLVFRKADNQIKGTWPVEYSPLQVRWPAASNAMSGGAP